MLKGIDSLVHQDGRRKGVESREDKGTILSLGVGFVGKEGRYKKRSMHRIIRRIMTNRMSDCLNSDVTSLLCLSVTDTDSASILFSNHPRHLSRKFHS